jgi:Ser/Thr protein kinase RdoA (MazF antagonist)
VYSTEQPADRASAVIQAYTTYNRIPRHPRSLDVAVIHTDGSLARVPGSCEFVLLQEYVAGELYFPSLMQSLEANEVSELEERRAVALAEYLAELHSQRNDDIRIYRRALRDLVAGGVGVMGVLGGYSEALRDAHHDRLGDILKDFIALAWDLDRYADRLCRIHGDFHPLNILFGKETQFSAIDAYGTGWGDAAFDVGTMLMNYYALYNEKGGLGTPSGRRLAERFLSAYVARCDDPEGLYRVLPLPLARGALIMATTDFFPHRTEDERGRLIRLAGDILSARVFTPSLFTPRE